MKQAKDDKTIDAFEYPAANLLNQIRQIMTEKTKRVEELQSQIDELTSKGIVKASLHYKAGKYLYLIHPTQGNGERIRKYVGAQPEKIKEAEKAIARYDTVEMLKGLVESHQNMIDCAEWKLKEIIKTLNRN